MACACLDPLRAAQFLEITTVGQEGADGAGVSHGLATQDVDNIGASHQALPQQHQAGVHQLLDFFFFYVKAGV